MSRRRRGPGVLMVSLVLAIAAAVALTWQVEVGDPSRSCGSAFDTIADRSSWETWWARDLDEATIDRPSDLVRTRECPDAVNLRTVAAAGLGSIGLVLAGLGGFRGRDSATDDSPPLQRIAWVATASGVLLTVAGVAAIVLLVADADSTLFLYTDRLVVAVVGLIVLVPAVALALGGWALHVAASPRNEDEGDAGTS